MENENVRCEYAHSIVEMMEEYRKQDRESGNKKLAGNNDDGRPVSEDATTLDLNDSWLCGPLTTSFVTEPTTSFDNYYTTADAAPSTNNR